MHLRTRTWFLISMLCFVGAAIFWQIAERKSARDQAERAAQRAAARGAATTPPSASPASTNVAGAPGPAPATATTPPTAATRTNAATASTNLLTRHRLANTTKTVGELSRMESGLMLRNALIDSANPVNLPIPAHLRASSDPGSYVV